jgi:hypothetical protein
MGKKKSGKKNAAKTAKAAAPNPPPGNDAVAATPAEAEAVIGGGGGGSSPSLNASLKECVSCKEFLKKNAYSANQWKKVRTQGSRLMYLSLVIWIKETERDLSSGNGRHK